jgi:glycosyltransferase involved in cell wall biosynthesis
MTALPTIALVSETYPPEINGVALTVKSLRDSLRKLGYGTQVIRPRQRTDQAADDEHLVRGAGLPRYPGLRFGWPATSTLKNLWRQHRPTGVYIATEGPLGFSAARAARALDIPSVSGFHTRFDSYAEHYGVAWLKRWVEWHLKRLHGMTRATLVPTLELKAELELLGFDNVRLLARAVDVELFDGARRSTACRESMGLTERDCCVLHVGRLAAEKNLDLLAESMLAMVSSNPRVRPVIVGDGPELKRLITSYPQIQFLGLKRGLELAEIYASADVFLFPSETETFGNVTLEALASELAVVAFDYGAAHQHIRHGRNGLLAPRGDGRRFVDLCRLLAREPVLQSSVRAQARASIQSLNPLTVADRLVSILREPPRHVANPRPQTIGAR